TRACSLACRHCRAEAIPCRDPRELDTGEGRRLLEALRAFGVPPPAVVLTGGDPLERPDFWKLLAHAVGLRLDVAVAPSRNPRRTGGGIGRLRQAGVRAMSLSLDGSDAARHDGFRGVPGCFNRTMVAAVAAVGAGLSLQVNTLATADTLEDLPRILPLVRALGAARWSLFFLIEVGRGRGLRQLTPAACARLLEWLAAPRPAPAPPRARRPRLHARGARGAAGGGGARPARHGFGIRDGNGVMFVSHTGDVQPSGFLPLVAGNVRETSLVELYRTAPLFR